MNPLLAALKPGGKRNHNKNTTKDATKNTTMSNPSTNNRSGLDGYSQPRLATQAEKNNFPGSLKNSEWKVQAITDGNREILLSNARTMDLVWFEYGTISPTDRRSAAATNSRKDKGGTLANDLVLARERQLGVNRSQATTAAPLIVPIMQQLPSIAAQAIAGPASSQQTTATTGPAGPATRSTTRDRTGWVVQEIRGEQGSKYEVQYAPDRNGMPRQSAQEWVHHTMVSHPAIHNWIKKKAGSVTAAALTNPVAWAPDYDAEMEDAEMEDADGEEVPEWDLQWHNQ